MIHRERLRRPTYVYPPEPWRLVERRFYPKLLAQTETFFTLANGYLGLRGIPDEGAPAAQRGAFVNGLYEAFPIVYGEEAFGFARTGQSMVSATEARPIRLYVDDEPFYLPTARLLAFERALDLRAGTLDREVLWETAAGKRVAIRSRRLVSLEQRHVAAIEYEVTVENASAPVVLASDIVNEGTLAAAGPDPRRPGRGEGRVLHPRTHSQRGARIVLGHATEASGMTLACGIDHRLETECSHALSTSAEEDRGRVVFSVEATAGAPVRLTKWLVYHSSRRAPCEELAERAERTLDRVAAGGFAPLLEAQRAQLDAFWERSDVEVEGDPVLQQAVRFNLFQMFQAAARAEGAGIPAKGLTGSGYGGHYFWDTEIYVLPFLVYTAPRIARNLLGFRYGLLEPARRRAAEVSQKGALFPWRTINGEEASAYYAAGTAQYHINADVVYAIRKYVEATGDRDFLHGEGAEILVETARLWCDLGYYAGERVPGKAGRFCIPGVTGPDEYNTVVNNNAFTNLMARHNLVYAADTVEALHAELPGRFAALAHETDVTLAEISGWRRAAERMYVPYDEKLGIHLQDDEFLEKKPWDFASTPPENYPLLLHYHPLVIYRSQVIKQADVVLALFLLREEFDPEQKRRDFDYYDPLTTGDSSLSASIQSIVAYEIGYPDTGREYMRYAALMDLADVSGNVADGLHIASMGGTWMALVYGVAGFRDHEARFRFRPRLPETLARVRFALTIRGSRLRVEVTADAVTYRLEAGPGLAFRHDVEELVLDPEAPVQVRAPVPPREPEPSPSPPQGAET